MQVDILGGLTQNFFAYDAMQNRIKKRKVVSGSDISTFYVRDAQGNVLAVYEKNGTTVTWKEQHLYGSSRLGTVEPGVAWTTTPVATPHFRSTRILNYGWKRYEVNDHLGNVRALINDRKTYGGATFTATLLDATDYFPFGAEMRKGTVTNSYRYGFNGKELDKNNEFGSLNHYDYGFRIYNPGIGRFLSVDPLTGDYPWYTPYQFAGNGPIANLDLDGLEEYYYLIDHFDKQGKPAIKTVIVNTDNVKQIGLKKDEFGNLVPKYNKETHNVVYQLPNGDWIGDTYNSEKEARNSNENDLIADAIFLGGQRGYELGEEVGDKINFLKGLAKRGFKKGAEELIILGAKRKFPRPKFRKGVEEQVWDDNKHSDGKVYDPDSGEEIEWTKGTPRVGKWDMGHKPGFEFWRSVIRFMKNLMTKKELRDEYNDPNRYRPELPKSNRSKNKKE